MNVKHLYLLLYILLVKLMISDVFLKKMCIFANYK